MKRTIITIVLAVAAMTMQAQTATLDKHSIDEFTGTETKTTKYVTLDNVRIMVAEISTEDDGIISVLYTYTLTDIGCSGVASNSVIFLFEDGSRMTLDVDISDIDCGRYAASYYILDAEQVNELSMKNVSKVKVSQSEGSEIGVFRNQEVLGQLLTLVKI